MHLCAWISARVCSLPTDCCSSVGLLISVDSMGVHASRMQQSSDRGKNRFGQIQMRLLTQCICEMSDRDKRWMGWSGGGGGG